MGKKLLNLLECKNEQRRFGITFWVFATVSIALIATGFLLPPQGQIDGSVLTACGEILIYPILHIVWSAIHKGTDVTVQHGNTSVSINNPDTPSE